MGSEESKTQMNHQSDAEVTIINNQNENAEKLENHAFILWVILAIVATQLAITLVGVVKRYMSRKTMKKAEEQFRNKPNFSAENQNKYMSQTKPLVEENGNTFIFDEKSHIKTDQDESRSRRV